MANNAHLIAWSRDGLEAFQCIQQYEDEYGEMVLEAVRTGNAQRSKLGEIIHFLRLRARFNSQRVFEVYAFDMSDDYTTQSFEDQFVANPQQFVDWIRKNGVKLHSDYERSNKAVIS